jgi:hypothetical protein
MMSSVDMVVYKRMTPSFFGRRGLHQILTQEYEGREKDVRKDISKQFLSLLPSSQSRVGNNFALAWAS